MKPSVVYQLGTRITEATANDLERVTRTLGVSPSRYAREAVLERLAKDLKQQVAPAPPAEQK